MTISTREDELSSPVELKLHPYKFVCDKPHCYLALAASSEADALRKQESHICPHMGGPTHLGATVTLTLVEEMWALADEMFLRFEKAMDEESSDPVVAEHTRYELLGISRAIAIFGKPFFPTVREVGEEIRKRYTERHIKGNADYETQGLGSRRYDFTGLDPKGRPETKLPSMADRLKVLTDKEKNAIKFANQSMPDKFTVPVLAKTYDLSEGLVREVLGLTGG